MSANKLQIGGNAARFVTGRRMGAPWPTALGIHANGCEGSSSLVDTSRALMRALGGGRRRVLDWCSEIHHWSKQDCHPECAHTAGRAADRLQCVYSRAGATPNATFVYKTGYVANDFSHAPADLLVAYRRLRIPILVYSRPSAYQGFACGVRDCFGRMTGGETMATLVDAEGRVVPHCRRFNNTHGNGRGRVADAKRAGVAAGSKVRIVTTNASAFCDHVLALHRAKRLDARVAYLQRARLLPPATARAATATARAATFEQLHLDANATRRAAKWASWLASVVPAIAAMPRARVEALIAARLPPPPPPLPVSAQYEDPEGVYALARAGGCADATAAAELVAMEPLAPRH